VIIDIGMRRQKTIAVKEDTYAMLQELKSEMGALTMDELLRKLLELAREKRIQSIIRHVRSKRLSDEELRELAKIRRKLREEGVWLKR